MRWGNQTDVKKHSQVLTEKRKRKGTHKKTSKLKNLKTKHAADKKLSAHSPTHPNKK